MLLSISCMDNIDNSNSSNTQTPEIIDLTSTSNDDGTEITLKWQVPDNSDLKGVEIIPTNSNAKSIKIPIANDNFTISGLTENLEYTFTVRTYDNLENFSPGLEVSATPISHKGSLIIDTVNHQRQIPEYDDDSTLMVHINNTGIIGDFVIRYTIDGSEVTESSQIYYSPFEIKPDSENPIITVKAKAFKKAKAICSSEKKYYKVIYTYYSAADLQSAICTLSSPDKLGPNGDYNNIGLGENLKSLYNLFNSESHTYASTFNGDISAWDVSHIKCMSNLFSGAKNFNRPLADWNVSNVKYMSGMFNEASEFNQSISNWNVSNVKSMMSMFDGAINFNQPLNNWDVSNVAKMKYMFKNASSFDQPLDNWNVSNVKTMSYMFDQAKEFNQALDSWDVSHVSSMQSMFNQAKKFNQSINNWDVSNVKDMSYMFNGASNFNKPLNKWNVSNVLTMEAMFANMISTSNIEIAKEETQSYSFNQDLSSWKLCSLNTADAMFLNNNSFSQDLTMWESTFPHSTISHEDVIKYSCSMNDERLPKSLKSTTP